jgi:hypothetical protein
MASAALEAIRTVHPNPKTHGDADIVAAYQISRMVRNAFAHSPFAPIWRIDPDCKNQIFEIPGVIRLDTSGIDGVHFDWRHYGGPLALLSLAEFVRITILADPSPPSQVVPLPSRFYYQQGDLILERLPPNHSAEPGSE